ncbi:hypothetical protein BWD14_01245 [Leptospira santarosai]|uniref:Uncharacterized protein n=1 Tax=Leptospira santarosai TaxID=28183 RepID=A0AB73LPV8_9LEPT|nr:hypothetical protein BWD14_01245 [Leptospira santarosai]
MWELPQKSPTIVKKPTTKRESATFCYKASERLEQFFFRFWERVLENSQKRIKQKGTISKKGGTPL